MTNKSLFYKNLSNTPVYIQDPYIRSPYYFNFVNIPSKLSLGKNSIRFSPNVNMLDTNYPIEFEFIDSYGNTVYYEYTDYTQSDDLNLKLITLYLYNTTPNGNVYMTAVGTAKSDLTGAPVPPEWKTIYNVKYEAVLEFERTNKNESELLYSTSPKVSILEVRRPYYNQSLTVSSSFTKFTGSGYYFYNQQTPVLELVNGEFTNDMIGGTIVITGSNLEPSNFSYPVSDYSTHTTLITNLINNKTAVLKSPYTASINASYGIGEFYFAKSNNECDIAVNYYITPDLSSTQNFKSYAYVSFQNFEPISGIAKKVQLFGKSAGGPDNYELLGESSIQNVELLINTGSNTNYDRRNVGYFINSGSYYNFWTFTNTNTTLDSSSLYNSVKLLPTSYPANMNSLVNITCQKGSPYKLILNYKSTGGTMKVYISGSAFSSYDNNGKLVSVIDTNVNGIQNQNYLIQFNADANGTGVIKFIIESGIWNVSDISFKCDAKQGFTPSIFNAYIPIVVKSRNDVYDFKVNVLDDLDRVSTLFFENSNITISGSNLYIQEADNLLTGSLYLGRSLNSGIEFNGDNKMIKSYGFDGTSGSGGFALWSGSQIVGNELRSGSGFIFETGAPNYQYIRASVGGELLISGSNIGNTGDSVSNTKFNSYTSSINNFTSSIQTPEWFQTLFGIPCNIDGANNGNYNLQIRCNNGVVTFRYAPE